MCSLLPSDEKTIDVAMAVWVRRVQASPGVSPGSYLPVQASALYLATTTYPPRYRAEPPMRGQSFLKFNIGGGVMPNG